MQLAKEELVSRRGRLWTWPDLPGGAEVRDAIRLDMPWPLGARILLAEERSRSVPSSWAEVRRRWAGGHEPGRPTVENCPGITAHLPGPAETRDALKIPTAEVSALQKGEVCTGLLGGLGGGSSGRLASAQVTVTSGQRVVVGSRSPKTGLTVKILS